MNPNERNEGRKTVRRFRFIGSYDKNNHLVACHHVALGMGLILHEVYTSYEVTGYLR